MPGSQKGWPCGIQASTPSLPGPQKLPASSRTPAPHHPQPQLCKVPMVLAVSLLSSGGPRTPEAPAWPAEHYKLMHLIASPKCIF